LKFISILLSLLIAGIF